MVLLSNMGGMWEKTAGHNDTFSLYMKTTLSAFIMKRGLTLPGFMTGVPTQLNVLGPEV